TLAWTLALEASSQDVESRERAAVKDLPVNTGYFSPSNRHKIKLSKGEFAQQLAARGARVIADYGEETVLEVDYKTAVELQKNPAVELRDQDNLIMLNAGSIDTTTRQGIALQTANAGGERGAKRMHLVQFAGPVK